MISTVLKKETCILIAPYLEDSPEREKDPDWVKKEIRSSCMAIVRELREKND